MKLVLSALIGALSLIPTLAAAQEAKFEPSTYPFLPELVVNEDQQVCGPFEYAVIEAFKRSDFEITINDHDWPEAKATWFKFSKSLNAESFGISVNYRQVDIDHDGRKEILAAVTSWQQDLTVNRHALALYRDPSAFERAIAKLPAETGGPPAVKWLSEDDLLAEATNAAVPATGNSNWAWDFSEPRVIDVNGDLYFVDASYSDDDASTSLWRLQTKGPSVLTCKVRTIGNENGLPIGLQDGASVARFDGILSKISGDDEACSGPHYQWDVMRAAKLQALRTANRPWAALTVEPYNTRREVDSWLDLWSHASIGNYRTHVRFAPAEASARRTLSAYYRDAFGLDSSIAERSAYKALDILTRMHFRFPRTYFPDRDPDDKRLKLERALLEGHPLAEIEAMLAAGAQISDAVLKRDFDYSSEPTLFYALEHPDLLAALVARGADVNASNSFGKPALMYAAQFNLLDSAKILLAKGANPNASTLHDAGCSLAVRYGDRTPLMYAAENAGYDMIALLIQAGADVAAVDSAGRSAGNYLERNTSISRADRWRIIELLRKPHP